jgi:hypothetical protein
MSANGEKRQAPRIQPFVAPCRYVVADARRPGFVTDLSTRGGRIHSDGEPPAVGASVTLEIRLSRRPTRLKVPAVVEWASAAPRGGHVFGVSFGALQAEAAGVLVGVVEEFRRRAASIEQR